MAKTYIATEDTQSDIRELVTAINNKLCSSLGGVLPHITVIAPTGCTITAANNSTTLTAEEENGIWQFSIPHLGEWTLTANKNGHSGRRKIQIESVKEYRVNMSYGLRYGYRISKTEGHPSARVEYLFDAVGFKPAAMDFVTGIFDYGDWGDKWFIKDNKPLMLKNDGTVDYYLNSNNYALKEDGTASDVANINYNGNAMAQFPLVWVKRYEDDNYLYEIISDVQYDEDYKAYAHTRSDGSIADYFYYSIFGGSGGESKIRSLSGKTLSQSLTAQQEINGCKANGAGWYTHTWSQRELIRTLCVLMGKSTDTQTVFGNGNCRGATAASGMLATGTLNSKGQFYGYNDSTHQVKVFHIEKFWGDQWDRIAGIINSGGKIYAKMTSEHGGYRVNDVTGYTDTGVSTPAVSQSYISAMQCNEYGLIPTAASGSATTYYCDGMWSNNNQLDYLFSGACAVYALSLGGVFSFNVNAAPSYVDWGAGCGLSCEQPSTAIKSPS